MPPEVVRTQEITFDVFLPHLDKTSDAQTLENNNEEEFNTHQDQVRTLRLTVQHHKVDGGAPPIISTKDGGEYVGAMDGFADGYKAGSKALQPTKKLFEHMMRTLFYRDTNTIVTDNEKIKLATSGKVGGNVFGLKVALMGGDDEEKWLEVRAAAAVDCQAVTVMLVTVMLVMVDRQRGGQRRRRGGCGGGGEVAGKSA